ncbi:glycine-rich RNA-binding protein 2, mitochondrial-like [Tripterygium wilfordii]|uniref:glycine-rich RNA-binding protein 2, mitochondrial-like n=1 Tax=Tripterygium wilfordii TaxID=458696 RepID=UPI0018F7F1BF|nr:glycine-rich RNA-binding protein 2, mitochondrial-like [Tripterygium wilfordii]
MHRSFTALFGKQTFKNLLVFQNIQSWGDLDLMANKYLVNQQDVVRLTISWVRHMCVQYLIVRLVKGLISWTGEGLGDSRLSNSCRNSQRFLGNISPSNSTYPASQFFFYRGFASKLFLKGVSFLTTEERLVEAFSQFGHVLEAKITRNKTTKRSKGYGYVTFAEQSEAHKALVGMNRKVLDEGVQPARLSPRASS